MLSRIVQPELLDALPCDHPDARHSRRDLRRINLLMGNPRWVGRAVRWLARREDRILELGAGDGGLLARFRRGGLAVDGIDLVPAPPGLPAAARWLRQDLRQFSRFSEYDAVYGNLIFHQLTEAELRWLGGRIRPHARWLVACEPVRGRHAQWVFRRCSRWLGANHVTRHDGSVSIAAGFLGDELPQLLGLAADGWTWHCTTTLRGAYHMVARRRGPR